MLFANPPKLSFQANSISLVHKRNQMHTTEATAAHWSESDALGLIASS